MLGTTKPPYTLARPGVAAARGRLRRPADRRHRATAVDRRRHRAARRRGVRAVADSLPQHDADARRRRRRSEPAQASLRSADLLLRAARLHRAGDVDGSRAGGGRHVRRRARGRRPAARPARVDRRHDGHRQPHLPSVGTRRARRSAPLARQLRRVPDHALPGLGPRLSRGLRAAAREQAVRDRRDEPRLSVLVRLLRGPDPPGAQVQRAQPEGARRRDRAEPPRARRRVLLLSGATRSRST